MTQEARPFFEQPILNSPYGEPTQHHPLDAEGQPLDEPPRHGRRKSELITPVPKPRKRKGKTSSKDQRSLDLHGDDGLSSEVQRWNIAVESVVVEGDLAVARVAAISARSLGDRPVARITVDCVFDCCAELRRTTTTLYPSR